MDAAAFQRQLAALRARHDAGAPSRGLYACEGCRRSVSCTFCRDCDGCYRCTHCVGCRDCSHTSHSAGCEGCHGCAYCVESTACRDSSYLVRCHDCDACVYCFGCVGLSRAEFHILNRPYTREAYFERVAALARALGLPSPP